MMSARELPPQRGVHRAVAANLAERQGQVVSLHRSGLQLAHQLGLRRQRLGDDEQAGRPGVQPVDYAWPEEAAYPGEIIAVSEKRSVIAPLYPTMLETRLLSDNNVREAVAPAGLE